MHVTSNLEYLQDVRNHGADSLLHFLLISRDERTRKTGLRDPGYTQRLCQGFICGGAEERGGPLLGLQEPGMLIGKIVLIRPSSLQMLGEGSLVGPTQAGGQLTARYCQQT